MLFRSTGHMERMTSEQPREVMDTAGDGARKELPFTEIVKVGAEVVGGGLTGAAAGFLIGGPAGSVVGGALGPVVKRGLLEFAQRLLSHREQVRVSAAAQFTLERFEALKAAGRPLRDDMPHAEDPELAELLEGVLQKARNSYQEKKVRLIANIFADFAFAKGTSVDDAQAILSLVESLSYRQLVILEVFHEQRSTLRTTDYRNERPASLTQLGVLEDAYQLSLRGLVLNQVAGATQADFMLGWHDVAPRHMRLTSLGTLLSTLTGAESSIPEDDRRPIREALSR